MTTQSAILVEKMSAAEKASAKSMTRIVFEQFIEHRLALFSLLIIILLCSVAIGADLISYLMDISVDEQDVFARYEGRSSEHLLGRDELGRDVLVRLIYGTRVSLLVAFVSAISSAIIGIAIGSLAGYFGGFIDTVLMRLTDSLLSLPTLPILIILAAVNFGELPVFSVILQGEDSSILKLIIILVIFSWMVQARLVRGSILSIKESEYVLAAKTTGMKDLAIIAKEILPNVLSPIIVAVTLNVGTAILYEAALSFLGLGIEPPTPSWGNMLFNAREMILESPILVLIPGIMITICVMSFNFLGDGLQDSMDPKAIRR